MKLPQDLTSYTVEEKLRDGGAVLIRAIRPDDKDRLLEHFRALSPDSRYFRFMGVRRELTAADLQHLTELDLKDSVGLVATLTNNAGEHIIGVGRYIREGHNTNRAEVAFAILDEHHGRGIGTLLLDHLADIARANGIDTFEATVMGGNRKMLDVFANSGFEVAEKSVDGTVDVSISIAKRS